MGNSIADAVLVFRDEDGEEWLCGARLGPVFRFQCGKLVDEITHKETEGRGFLLKEIKIIEDDQT
jgi:hypothetical protein